MQAKFGKSLKIRSRVRHLAFYMEVLNKFNQGWTVHMIMNWMNGPPHNMNIQSTSTIYTIRNKALVAAEEEFKELGSLQRHMLLAKNRRLQFNLEGELEEEGERLVKATEVCRKLIEQEAKLLGLEGGLKAAVKELGAGLGEDETEGAQDYAVELTMRVQKLKERDPQPVLPAPQVVDGVVVE